MEGDLAEPHTFAGDAAVRVGTAARLNLTHMTAADNDLLVVYDSGSKGLITNSIFQGKGTGGGLDIAFDPPPAPVRGAWNTGLVDVDALPELVAMANTNTGTLVTFAPLALPGAGNSCGSDRGWLHYEPLSFGVDRTATGSAVDLDDLIRPYGPSYDLGAFECQPTPEPPAEECQFPPGPPPCP